MRGKVVAIERCYTIDQIEEIRREAAIEERQRIKRSIEKKWKMFIEDVKLFIGTFSFILACAVATWFLL